MYDCMLQKRLVKISLTKTLGCMYAWDSKVSFARQATGQMSLLFKAYLRKLVFLFYHRIQIWKLSPSQTTIDTRIIENKTRDPPWLEQNNDTTNASWLDSGIRLLVCCRTVMIMLNMKETLQLPPQ